MSIFSNELDKEEMRRTDDLKKMMKTAATPEEKSRIKRMIEETKAEFKAKRKTARSSLFLRQ